MALSSMIALGLGAVSAVGIGVIMGLLVLLFARGRLDRVFPPQAMGDPR
jgi:hypothetical protein